MSKPLRLYWHADKKDWLPYKPGAMPFDVAAQFSFEPVPEEFDGEKFNRSAIEKIAMAAGLPFGEKIMVVPVYTLWLEIDAGEKDRHENHVLSKFGEEKRISVVANAVISRSFDNKEGAYNFYGKTCAEAFDSVFRSIDHINANMEMYAENHSVDAINEAMDFLRALAYDCGRYPKCVIKVL